MTYTTPDSVTANVDKVTAARWNNQLRASLETVKKESIFIAPHAVSGTATLASTFGNFHTGASIGNASADGIAIFDWRVPTEFVTLSKAVIIVRSNETGDLRYAVDSEWGADGEAFDANNDVITATVRAMTAAEMDEIDISAAFTGIVAGDIIGLHFSRIGSHATDTITTLHVVGLFIEWVP